MKVLPFIFVLGIAVIAHAQDPAPKRLPLQVDGPVKISPEFAASQARSTAEMDRYVFSAPPPIFISGHPSIRHGFFRRVGIHPAWRSGAAVRTYSVPW